MGDGVNLLYSILANGSLAVFRECTEDWFIHDELPLFIFVRTHLRRYGRLPSVNTAVEETGINAPELPETIEYYKQRVTDRALYSELRTQFGELRDSLRAFNMEDARGVVNSMHRSVRVVNLATDIRTFDEAIADVYRRYEIAHSSPGESGVTVGWSKYDGITGGYQSADLVAIVARPEIGKTYTLLRQTYGAWLNGYSTLCVTMEMSIEQITRRLVGISTGLNPDRIRKGMLSTRAQERLRTLADGLSGVDRLRLYSGGFKKRVGDIDTLIAEYTPDIVFVDGVYVVKSDTSNARAGRFERIADMFDELKAMTIARSVPIVCTTQFNRSAGKKGKDGSLESLAFSDALAMHCSLIVSLKEGRPPYKTTRRVLEFIKGREGESGTVEINYRFNPLSIEEVEDTDSLGADSNVSTSVNLDWVE